MSNARTDFKAFLKEEVDKVKGIYYPVRAGFFRLAFIRNAPCRELHPNPEDEFCSPEIGPNFEIITRYERDYRNPHRPAPGMKRTGIAEPLMVQKARPDGYLIMNGHHRWAAAIRSGVDRVKIKIVNLTQVADVWKMLLRSQSDRRVTLDLDETVFCGDDDALAIQPLHFPLNRIYPEKIRIGIPALLHYFNEHDYDVWVYTSKLYSMEYIKYLFKLRGVRLTGVLTGSGRTPASGAHSLQEITDLLNTRYASTIHIDSAMLLRTFSGSKERDEYPLDGESETWSRRVIEAMEKIRHKDEMSAKQTRI